MKEFDAQFVLDCLAVRGLEAPYLDAVASILEHRPGSTTACPMAPAAALEFMMILRQLADWPQQHRRAAG